MRTNNHRSLLSLSCLLVLCGCGSQEGPPYAPEDALETFRLPEGFQVELVAAEPDLVDPVAIAFDADGRLFAVEMIDYPMDAAPLGRIKLLEDTDGDGKMDGSTVFAEGLNFPTGVMPWKEGVLVPAAPDIFYLADADGDGRADQKRVVLTGFNPYNPQLRVNGLLYGIDNWIYGAYPKVGPSRRNPELFGNAGEPLHFPDHPEFKPVDVSELGMDFRFRPEVPKLEPAAGNSQYGNTFDAIGNRFALWNSNHIRHVVIPYPYLRRNPYLVVQSAMNFPSDHENQSIVYPITKDPIFIHESQSGMFTSACGNAVYTGGNWPGSYEGAYFVSEPVHNLVHCDILQARGATYVARRYQEETEFLRSTDPWFKPVFTTVGPDGALYVVDYYRAYVEHPDYLPEDLVGKVDLTLGRGMGRIYRIVHRSSEPVPRPRLKGASSVDLVNALSHRNMWWRITAQRLLVDRQDRSVVPGLRKLAVEGVSAQARIHALWTLEGLASLDEEIISRALEEGSPVVREHAVRLAEQNLTGAIRKKLLEMSGDSDDRVLFQLACTLGAVPVGEAFHTLKEIAMRKLEDEWFQFAVLTSAADNGTQWFEAVVKDQSFLKQESPEKSDFLGRIGGIVGARQRKQDIGAMLSLIGQGREEWWRTASLKGLAEGLARGEKGEIQLAVSLQAMLLNLIEADSPQVASAALDVAERVGLAESAQLKSSLTRAKNTAAGSEEDVQARVNAVRLLGLDPSGASVSLLQRLLSPQQPGAVQTAAARALVEAADSRAIELFIENWSASPPGVREIATRALFSNEENIHRLLDAAEQGTIQPWTLERRRINQLQRSSDEQIRARANAVFGDLATDRDAVIERYRDSLTQTGDPARGREVFERSCSGCHRVADSGYEVGPDLVNLAGRRSKGFYLIQILDPNADISPGYEEYVVTTREGERITGILAEESATSITLRREEGAEDIILRGNIAQLRPAAVSSMPEGLEKEITVEEMAHLLEYLQKLRDLSASVANE